MTDVGQDGTEWVPRFGMLDVSPEHQAVIRGLFELAAFVADHPELPAPDVDVSFFTGTCGWESQRAMVDQVAVALGQPTREDPERGAYGVRKMIGPVRVWATAFTAETLADQSALLSYSGSVHAEPVVGESL